MREITIKVGPKVEEVIKRWEEVGVDPGQKLGEILENIFSVRRPVFYHPRNPIGTFKMKTLHGVIKCPLCGSYHSVKRQEKTKYLYFNCKQYPSVRVKIEDKSLIEDPVEVQIKLEQAGLTVLDIINTL